MKCPILRQQLLVPYYRLSIFDKKFLGILFPAVEKVDYSSSNTRIYHDVETNVSPKFMSLIIAKLMVKKTAQCALQTSA